MASQLRWTSKSVDLLDLHEFGLKGALGGGLNLLCREEKYFKSYYSNGGLLD